LTRIEKEKQEPLSFSLFNQILPLCCRMIARETCRPRPIPAIFLEVAELARQNRLNRLTCSRFGYSDTLVFDADVQQVSFLVRPDRHAFVKQVSYDEFYHAGITPDRWFGGEYAFQPNALPVGYGS
jgi:hypothetical protein